MSSEPTDAVLGCENVPTDSPSLHQLLAEYSAIGYADGLSEGVAAERARIRGAVTELAAGRSWVDATLVLALVTG